MQTERLIQIAQDLDLKDLAQELELIKEHEDSPTCPLMLPLVGEFSSGKTTLSPNGCSWCCITTVKKLTATKCGAVFAGSGWSNLASIPPTADLERLTVMGNTSSGLLRT